MPSPLSQPSTDPVIETRLFWDRHKTEILVGLIIAFLAIAAYGGYQFYDARRETTAAAALANAKTQPDFQKVIAQYPGTSAAGSAYLFMAEEQRKEKKFTEANATLQTFIDKNPKHQLSGTARMAMAANLESLGKKDEALTMYQRLAANDPHGFSAPIAMISEVPLLKEKNQIEEARRVCETILTQYRDSVVSGEASRQLRLLKVPGTTPAPSPAAVVPPTPMISAVPAGPRPAAPPAKKP